MVKKNKLLDDYLDDLDLDDDLKKRFPNAESAPKSEGIYYFIKNNSIQYVGKSNNLKNRIRTHLSYSRTYKSNKIVETPFRESEKCVSHAWYAYPILSVPYNSGWNY